MAEKERRGVTGRKTYPKVGVGSFGTYLALVGDDPADPVGLFLATGSSMAMTSSSSPFPVPSSGASSW